MDRGTTFIKCRDPKIVLLHRCQNRRFMNNYPVIKVIKNVYTSLEAQYYLQELRFIK